MKEKIIKILKSHSYHHTEGVGRKSQFKYLAEIAFECCADEIMLALDQSQFTADEAEEHINQEVEKRIAERMPSEEEIDDKSIKMFDSAAFRTGIKWLRSRLTQPNNSESTTTWVDDNNTPLAIKGKEEQRKLIEIATENTDEQQMWRDIQNKERDDK